MTAVRLSPPVGDDRWRTLLDWHDRALREAFVEHGGSEIKHEGDGFFVAFDAGESALRAACGIQRRLAGHRREAGFAPDVRIGVHEGSALARGDDWIGFAVTLAARVAASAGAGEVVCTDAVLERAPGAQVSDTRTIEAKGVDGPVQVHRIEACR